MAAQQKVLNTTTVREAYRRWAPVYDTTFGTIAAAARRKAVEHINQRRGTVLEVGVGTGLSLPNYAPYLKISGIDLSPEMLEKARERVAKEGLRNIEGLREMDAAHLDFADDYFNTVVAMYVMTVVPDPDRVMAELERVCAPGGEVMILNHFSQDHGARGWVERKMAPFADKLGWHPIFPLERVMVRPRLSLIECVPLWPMGLFTLVRFRKLKASA
ncbi:MULTISPECIES: class I SAM-dependent methyltransferase [Rhodomicrobium]|uniref:class I SAM-dependent methyltransferase n=1 Tax=Rhodomicrobium TaxID=1068 RepID=UPI000B4B7F5E|nr:MULTISPECIES: class I SAM-dependent methyltransferase [Rhodomicrobium]